MHRVCARVQEGELFHCAEAFVTLVTVSVEASCPVGAQGGAAAGGAEAGWTVPGGTPVQLPFVLAPSSTAEVMQAQVRARVSCFAGWCGRWCVLSSVVVARVRVQGAVRRRDERLTLRAALTAEAHPAAHPGLERASTPS